MTGSVKISGARQRGMNSHERDSRRGMRIATNRMAAGRITCDGEHVYASKMVNAKVRMNFAKDDWEAHSSRSQQRISALTKEMPLAGRQNLKKEHDEHLNQRTDN